MEKFIHHFLLSIAANKLRYRIDGGKSKSSFRDHLHRSQIPEYFQGNKFH
jgi:hypothetical protein